MSKSFFSISDVLLSRGNVMIFTEVRNEVVHWRTIRLLELNIPLMALSLLLSADAFVSSGNININSKVRHEVIQRMVGLFGFGCPGEERLSLGSGGNSDSQSKERGL